MKAWIAGRLNRAFRARCPVVLQSEMLECAHACLAMIGAYHGAKWTLDRLRERFTPSTRGTGVNQIGSMANDIGLHARILRAEPHHLAQIALPCIVHWDASHYVILERIGTRFTFELIDPAIGRLTVGKDEFNKRFSGIAVELSPGSGIAEPVPEKANRALQLIRSGVSSHTRTLAVIVVLAFMLEGLSLVSPLLIQVATDKAIPTSDASLLVMLCIAFGVASLLQAAISMARTGLLLRISADLLVTWNTEICDRILKLPYIFFLRRSLGDLTSRFRSIDVIQRTLTAKFLQGALDGGTSLLVLAIILGYSKLLVAITAGFTLAYGAIRLLALPRLIAVTEGSIRLQASQHSLLLEILRGIHSIKANGYEANQLGRYHAKTKAAAQSSLQLEAWTASIDELGQLVVRLHWIAAVGAASMLVMQGALTAGMLIAYITYAHQFATRSTRLFDRFIDWKLLLLHGSRVSELIGDAAGRRDIENLQPSFADHSLSIRNLTFRYIQHGRPILDELTLSVGDGACIAITGPSGSGKSTLSKVIMGLLEPDSGVVEIGGVDMRSIGTSRLREHISCVMQDDQLFNGSIAGNIAFFEPGYSREAVIAAAKLAQIHDEIMAMPLQYETRIFDLGATLSGGQRQRLVLARALYRRPSVLILDEASSHLDLDNERLVNEAVSALRITRIIIAHRPTTLEMADIVYELRDGRLATRENGRGRIEVNHMEKEACE